MTCSITPDSLRAWPNNSIAVVAHDAGAAQLLLSWIKPLDKQLRFFMEGPALEMLCKERPNVTIEKNLETCINRCELLLSGTGWSSNLEHLARCIAQQQKIQSVAVIDHWVNYNQRFIRNEQEVLPQGIWVSDKEAEILARQHFPKQWIKQLDNKWLNQLAIEVKHYQLTHSPKAPKSPASRLLYLLEPLRDPISGHQNNGEFHALDYWLTKLTTLMNKKIVVNDKKELRLCIRRHPSEPVDKYKEWIEKHQEEWNVEMDKCISLSESLGFTDMVFGCETQALVAAIECGLTVYSTLPPEFPPNRLPHKQLRHLSVIR